MALQIGKECIACYACETVCPTEAISIIDNLFVIDSQRCNECSDNDSSRCIAICPEEGVITPMESQDAALTRQTAPR